jgi:hypothetical protein
MASTTAATATLLASASTLQLLLLPIAANVSNNADAYTALILDTTCESTLTQSYATTASKFVRLAYTNNTAYCTHLHGTGVLGLQW